MVLVGGQLDTKDLKVNSGFIIFFDEGLDWTTTTVSVEDCVSVFDNEDPICAKRDVHYNTIFKNLIKTTGSRSHDYWIQYPV